MWQWVVKLWFVLIAVSTLLTWQHQVVDVLGGLGLAVVCFYSFRETPACLPVTPNYRVGSYYSVGSLVLAGTGILWPWLLWPALRWRWWRLGISGSVWLCFERRTADYR